MHFKSADSADSGGQSKTIPLSPAIWEQLRSLCESETGMDLSGTRAVRLEDALRKVAAPKTTSSDVAAALGNPVQRVQLIERLTGELTIGESFFFRNEHHFRVLREHVIPDILRSRGEPSQVRVWAAGCAGGEEPFSLAILFDMVLGSPSPWQVSVLGTDLNSEFLSRARTATFRPWSFRQTDVHQDPKYFRLEGGNYHLVSHVRHWVRFAYLNLVKDVYPSSSTGTLGLDLIVFRNVAIYLKPEVTAAIIQRFYQALRPGGWLLLGEAEVSGISTDGFVTRRFPQATLHQKPVDGRGPSSGFAASKAPVLAEITPESRSEANSPTLPDWVPLPNWQAESLGPARRTDVEQHREVHPTTPRTPREQIKSHLANHEFKEAELLIDKVANRSDRNSLRLKLVRTLMAVAERSTAWTTLRECLREEPLSIETQLLSASLAEEDGDWTAAEQACRRALYLDRNCVLAHFRLALILQQRGDDLAAKRHWRIALNLINAKEPHELVDYGDGVCYGRLREMISLFVPDA